MTHTDVRYLETNIFWLFLLAFGILFFCEWSFYKLSLSLNSSELSKLSENDSFFKKIKKIKNTKEYKIVFLGAFLVAIILFLMTSLLFPYKEINTYRTIQIDQKIENSKNSNYCEYKNNKIHFINRDNENKIETLKLNDDTKVYIKNKSNENKIEIHQKKYVPILGNYENKIVKVNIYND